VKAISASEILGVFPHKLKWGEIIESSSV